MLEDGEGYDSMVEVSGEGEADGVDGDSGDGEYRDHRICGSR